MRKRKATMTISVNKIRNKLNDDGVLFSRVFKYRKGKQVYVAQSNFFYRMGYSAEGFAGQIEDALEDDDCTVEILSTNSIKQSWPNDSYFEVVFKLTKANKKE